MKTLVIAVASAVVLGSVAASGALGGKAPGTSFGAPVKVTPELGFGYEPAVYTDYYGNIFATAHKENWQLVLAPDLSSPTYTRSMSWAWVSSNGGASFTDLPGLTALSFEQHDFGDEGDMALDDANHLYFVDTNVEDVTFTRWTISGLGSMALDLHRPFLPAAETVDDRPWVTAHGSSSVFYFGNQGDKVTYPLGHGEGSGFGPGRYSRTTGARRSIRSATRSTTRAGAARPPTTRRDRSTSTPSARMTAARTT